MSIKSSPFEIDQIKFVFHKEKLEQTLGLLRASTKIHGPEFDLMSTAEQLDEILRLADVIEKQYGSGHPFKIKAELLATEGTSETRVILEPTQWLLEGCPAFNVGTLEG